MAEARDHKKLFQVSYVQANGLRVLFGPAQGRFMHKTREEAEAFLAALMENSGEDRLCIICGVASRGTFRVDEWECYDHGDPIGIYQP